MRGSEGEEKRGEEQRDGGRRLPPPSHVSPEQGERKDSDCLEREREREEVANPFR